MNEFATNEVHKPPRIGNLAVISAAMLGAVGAVGPALSADLPDDYPPYRPTYYQNYSGNYDSGYSGCYSCNCCAPRPVRAERPPMLEERPPVIEERPPFAEVERPVVERGPVAERHWVQRDYIERRYPSSTETTRYGYSSYPGPGAESYRTYERIPYREQSAFCQDRCPSASAYEPAPYRERPAYEPAPYRERPAYEPAPYRERRRRFSDVGAHYPPTPTAYKYESEPRAPYRYAASSHPPYDYYRPSYEPGYNPAYQYQPAYEHEPSPRPPAAVPGGYYGRGNSE